MTGAVHSGRSWLDHGISTKVEAAVGSGSVVDGKVSVPQRGEVERKLRAGGRRGRLTSRRKPGR